MIHSKFLKVLCVVAMVTVLVFSVGCGSNKKKKKSKKGANVSALVQKAQSALTAGNLTEAINYANKAIKKNSKSGKAYMIRAMAHEQSGQTGAAIDDFKKSATLSKDFYSASQVANLYRKQGNSSEAASWDATAMDYQQATMSETRERNTQSEDKKRSKRQARERNSN